MNTIVFDPLNDVETIVLDPIVGMALIHAVRQLAEAMAHCQLVGPSPAVERVEVGKHLVKTSSNPDNNISDVVVRFDNGIRIMVVFDEEQPVSLYHFYRADQAMDGVSLR